MSSGPAVIKALSRSSVADLFRKIPSGSTGGRTDEKGRERERKKEKVPQRFSLF
jgi:hypothetical protein